MAFREVRVFEVREVLRLWLAGDGIRSIERLSQVDRKTVRRYMTAAETLGLTRDGGDDQLGDVFIGMVVEAVRPHRSDGHGEAWRLVAAEHDRIAGWVNADLTGVKIHELLDRQVRVPRSRMCWFWAYGWWVRWPPCSVCSPSSSVCWWPVWDFSC